MNVVLGDKSKFGAEVDEPSPLCRSTSGQLEGG
jgi:hypothetical protein